MLGRTARQWGMLGEARFDLAALAKAEDDTRLRLLADTLRRIGGGDYPPRSRALQGIWQTMVVGGTATLAGCLVLPDGNQATILREPSACAAPVPLEDGAQWDRRWRLELGPGWPDGQLGPLGQMGRRRIAFDAPGSAWAMAPRRAQEGAPALFATDGTLLAVPFADWQAPGIASLGLKAGIFSLDRATQT